MPPELSPPSFWDERRKTMKMTWEFRSEHCICLVALPLPIQLLSLSGMGCSITKNQSPLWWQVEQKQGLKTLKLHNTQVFTSVPDKQNGYFLQHPDESKKGAAICIIHQRNCFANCMRWLLNIKTKHQKQHVDARQTNLGSHLEPGLKPQTGPTRQQAASGTVPFQEQNGSGSGQQPGITAWKSSVDLDLNHSQALGKVEMYAFYKCRRLLGFLDSTVLKHNGHLYITLIPTFVFLMICERWNALIFTFLFPDFPRINRNIITKNQHWG